MGETVVVLVPRETGTDSMGEPIVEWDLIEVPGCLVRPLNGTDAAERDSSAAPHARKTMYRVAFPKTYIGPVNEALSLCRVALIDRGMDAGDAGSAYIVTVSSDHVRPCPTAWDMTADIGRAYG